MDKDIAEKIHHRLYLTYPFVKSKAYKLEIRRNTIAGNVIIIRNKRTNEIVGDLILKEEIE